MAAAEARENPPRSVDGQLTIEVVQEEEACLLRLWGEMDMATAPALQKELSRAISRSSGSVVLDLGPLEFIDVAGLRCLLEATVRSRGNGDGLRMVLGQGQVARLVALTGLGPVLPLIR